MTQEGINHQESVREEWVSTSYLDLLEPRIILHQTLACSQSFLAKGHTEVLFSTAGLSTLVATCHLNLLNWIKLKIRFLAAQVPFQVLNGHACPVAPGLSSTDMEHFHQCRELIGERCSKSSASPIHRVSPGTLGAGSFISVNASMGPTVGLSLNCILQHWISTSWPLSATGSRENSRTLYQHYSWVFRFPLFVFWKLSYFH